MNVGWSTLVGEGDVSLNLIVTSIPSVYACRNCGLACLVQIWSSEVVVRPSSSDFVRVKPLLFGLIRSLSSVSVGAIGASDTNFGLIFLEGAAG